MRILFLFGHELVLGGHFKSAKAFAEQLINRDHEIYVMAKGGKPETINPFIQAGAEFISLSSDGPYSNSFFQKLGNNILPNKSILKIIKNKKIEVIHAHDSPIMSKAYFTACLTRRGFVYSQAGGSFRDTYPPVRSKFFVFSQELLSSYKNTSRASLPEIHLIRERINTEIYKPVQVNKKLIQKYNLPQEGFTILN